MIVKLRETQPSTNCGALDPSLLSFGYSVGGERVYKRFRYCWQDICIDDTVTSFPEEEELMGFVPEDSGLFEDSGFFWDSLGWMQTMGTTPPGEEPGICTFYDTVLTWYIVSNGKVLAEYDGLTKALHYKYIYAGDQRVAMRDGVNRLHYYLNDHLGSARVVIDSAGTIKDKYHYLAFGSPLDVTFSTGQPNRYTGKPYDMDAGMNLYYYGARYYDAELGRFTQVDPLRNKYPDWGAYVYCADNPLKYTDPNGKWREGIHDKILSEAIGDLVTDDELAAIQRGSAYADEPQFQDPEHNFMHGMRSEGQSPQEAEKQMSDFIADKTNDFVLGTGDEALESLGQALHPIMDMASPAHKGFQVWKGQDGESKMDMLKHFLKESRKSVLTDDQWKELVQTVRQAYQGALIKRQLQRDTEEKWKQYSAENN